VTGDSITIIRKRADFLAANRGLRNARAGFVLLTRANEGLGKRFGVTVTKKIGNAVVRNRIRRRLKAALTPLSAQLAVPTHDYVVIARQPAFDIPFATLQKDLERALQRVHHAGAARDGRRAGRVT
jgi:ribonuclease P protein component